MLRQLLGGNSALKRTADRVFKLFLKEGLNNDVIYTYSFGKKDKTEHYALLSVHIDVQNKKVINFGKRMHTMAYRLIDKSDLPVYSIAITSFNTNNVEEFYYRVGETKVGCEFKCINLLNFNDNKKGNGQASTINEELLSAILTRRRQ